MALNETDTMRVHISFKKYIKGIKEKSGIPIVKITKRIAEDRPVVPVPIQKKRR